MNDNYTYVIYGLRLKTESEYRYVGMTTRDYRTRMSHHKYCAYDKNSHYAVYCWMRKYTCDDIVMDILEKCPRDDFDYLCLAEIYWIKTLKHAGHYLLNHTDGGDGVLGLPAWNKGIPMTVEQKETLRRANLGRKLSEEHKNLIKEGVNKHYKNNKQKSVYDYWVTEYGVEEADRLQEEKRKKASKSLSGEGNPMYGRTGQSAPAYGRVGDKHPMYGKSHTEEARRKISEAQKGRIIPESTKLKRSHTNHIRQHVDVFKNTCKWCNGAVLMDELDEIEKDKLKNGKME